MSHRIIGTDNGDECFVCGAAFYCSICTEQTDAGEWSDHECETEALHSIVECFKGDACMSDESPDPGRHYWTAGREDDTAECHFCPCVRGEGWIERIHVGSCPSCDAEIWVNAAQWELEPQIDCPDEGINFRRLFPTSSDRHAEWRNILDWAFVKRHADEYPFKVA